MKTLKKPLVFSCAMLPVTVAAVILTVFYQLRLYPADFIDEAVNQLGSRGVLIALTTAQGSLIITICCFFGYILADKTGLWRPFYIEGDKLLKVLAAGIASGLVLSLDYWTFGLYEPLIQSSITESGLSAAGIGAAILYGGVIEELLMRLFVMSLAAFVLWKLFCKEKSKETIPDAVFISANIISSLLFAAGHLPATAAAFGVLTPMLLVRCFLINGGFGLLFGRLYRKCGIWYAMAAHMLIHIISKAVWIVLI